MASQPLIPPFLLPRGISKNILLFLNNARNNARPQPQLRQKFSTSSNSSAKTPPSGGRVLEKPDRFRPPSHPSRRVMNPRRGAAAEPRNYPGPKLSEAEAAEKKTKKYPNMFPPEGTVMHKFLTSRGIHVWISMSVLTSLALFTFTTNFKLTSPFAHLLPPWSQLLTHPIDTVSQVLMVWKMHADHRTMETMEKRKRRTDDVEKRRMYRVSHGLEEEEGKGEEAVAEGGFGEGQVAVEGAEEGEMQERSRRPVKKWLGIW
ncbi:hypothetical protein AJ79_07236 [Helicocarpus griseus UAMH5409]|uniref:Uncharacterized protein n=1 Tax=Helicocarpus griseus UAMH5409 TaxID=1447875 RepID=A0A2B7X5D4_9EURO|nr:hypothetical protein AJ79_07236 [Helicocarpus griseus UAMH5409]